MISPPQPENQPASGRKPVLDNFIQRLIGAISQSPLLRARLSRTGRLLDCCRLEQVTSGLSKELLEAVLDGAKPVPVQLDLRALREGNRSEGADPLRVEPEPDEEQIDERVAQEHLRLYKTLEKISRDAELVKRETGRHALWLGYPLLYAEASASDILAPVFLWPIFIRFDYRRQGRVFIGRAGEQQSRLPPQFNRAMAAWLSRQCGIRLDAFSEAELSEFDAEAVEKELEGIAAQFHPNLHRIDGKGLLESIPSLKSLDPHRSPCYYHSAVIGYFRWQNEAVLADLESLRKQDECPGVARAFVCGADLPAAPQVQPPTEEDRFLVCDADFSQERVVWQAREQPGLVVHGPPGTGKSQTIVNIIADALAHHRTVLMVCQKQAATRVVLERLRAVGLGDLCLEVHDAAADRQEVFKTIRDQVAQLKGRPLNRDQARAQLSRQIAEKEGLLDKHARALHEQHPQIGLSYKQMKAREGRLLDEFPCVRELVALHKALETLSAQQVWDLLSGVRRTGQAFRQADPLNNPWRERQPTVMATPAMRADVTAAVKQLAILDSEHVQHVQKHGAGRSLPVPIDDFTSLAFQLVQRLRHLQASNSLFRITRGWTTIIRRSDDEELPHHEHQCEIAIKLAKLVGNTSLDPQWSSLLGTRTDCEFKELRSHAKRVLDDRGRWWTFLSLQSWRARRALAKFGPNTSGECPGKTAESLLAHLDAQQARKELGEINKGLVPPIHPKTDERQQVKFPKQAREAFEIACWLRQQQRGHEWCRPLIDQVLEDPNRLGPTLEDLERDILRAPLVRKLLDALTGLETFLIPQALEAQRARIRDGKSIRSWIESLAEGLDKLQPLLALDADRQHRKAPERDILEALEVYEKQLAGGEKLPAPSDELAADQCGAWWSALVEYTAVMMWQREWQLQHPVLLQVTSEVHQKNREELGELLERKRELEAATIREGWLERQLQYRNCPWPKLFQQKSSKQNKAPRLREAVAASVEHGLLAMRPCWLVNPEAAAQIFPLQCGLFDLVIFDEASQCPIEQAVPAIYRGKTLIVSGDEKQLPPTGFFAARADGGATDGSATEEDDAEEVATDDPVQTRERAIQKLGAQFLFQVEDLLEAAIGNLPQQWLRVHYRSEHPDLIAFSNRAFYNGQLEAPPSRFSRQSDDRPIVYHDVGGLYADRTNRQEADKVVQLLKDFWAREGPAPTIGVVTFNQPQRELIEDLIAEECQRDEAFEPRYAQEKARKEGNQDVGFFVKNLENVQGDERDVMIFSTTFGRDSSGRFFRRFGPVGATGGERRLNVAVTRAKSRVIVVGSMPIDEISDALQVGTFPGTGTTPAGYLQLYLAYAQAVSLGNGERRDQILDLLKRQAAPAQLGGEPESPFEEEVRQSLEKLGYTVHSQVGESGFRIDLAVLHPQPARGYVLGIECDGASYHSGRSARIRDVWREKILRKRGWRIHRVWSTAWWYQRADEVEKLEYAVTEASMEEFRDQIPASDSQLRKLANHERAGCEHDCPDVAAQEGGASETSHGTSTDRVPSNTSQMPESPDPDEDKTLETLYRELKVSWDILIAKYGLVRPIDKKMTLREARSRRALEPKSSLADMRSETQL